MENTEYLKLKDEFKVSDSYSKVRGIVVCRDIDGNILFKKENMIVKSGRKLLMNLLNNSSSNSNLTQIEFYPLFGSTEGLTSPDFDVDTKDGVIQAFGYDSSTFNAIGDLIDQNTKLAQYVTPEEGKENTQKFFMKINEDNLFIQCHFEKASTYDTYFKKTATLKAIASLGIVYKSGNDYHLFSRVTFPKYEKSTNLVFDYYIYF